MLRVRPRALALAATALLACVALAHYVVSVPEGLLAPYYANPEWVAPPSIEMTDPRPSTSALQRAWQNTLPETFSATWSGFLLPSAGWSMGCSMERWATTWRFDIGSRRRGHGCRPPTATWSDR